MIETSDLYQKILTQTGHSKDVKCIIGGAEHEFVSATVSGGFFKTPSVGNCPARQVDLEIFPSANIPRMAKIELFVRLSSADGTQKSEWIPKGVFFIDTRSTDSETGLVTITGFDAMLKMEQPMIATGEASGTWPVTPQGVMERIAQKIDVEIDPRSQMNPAFQVPFPPSTSVTVRQVAGWVAAANCANWTISDEGKLLLVPLIQKVSVLSDETGHAILFGNVVILA